MKQTQKQKFPKKKQPFFSFIKRILRPFYKKPKIRSFGEAIVEPSIILSNHVSMKGPMVLELYLPVPTVKWGAGEMLGNYKTRYRYMRDVFYIQKQGYGKVKATLRAAFLALFSKFIYKGMNVVSTWSDEKMIDTLKLSMDVLSDGGSVLIFPENSNEGYKDILTEFHAGFVVLAQYYYLKTKKDLPVYPVYYHDKEKVIAIGEPMYVQDFVRQGLSQTQIAEEFRKAVNGLYSEIQT